MPGPGRVRTPYCLIFGPPMNPCRARLATLYALRGNLYLENSL